MLKQLLYIITIFAAVFTTACKQDSAGKSANAETAVVSTVAKNDDKGKYSVSPAQIKEMNTFAEIDYKGRVEREKNKSYPILTKGIWVYDGVFNEGRMADASVIAGHWIDFNDDLTYTYGTYDHQDGKGKYIYQLEFDRLLLIDNDATKKPNEFKVKTPGDILILMGQPQYKDNSFQAKLSNKESKPVEGAK